MMMSDEDGACFRRAGKLVRVEIRPAPKRRAKLRKKP
jgi:hypothetical protein